MRGASIPFNVLELISSEDFYWNNILMLRVLKPIADCVGNLEGRDAHIGLVLYEFMVLFKRIKAIPTKFYSGANKPTSYNKVRIISDAVKHALAAIRKRFDKVIHEDIYIVAMFLTPEYRSLPFSGTRAFDLKSICTIMCRLIRRMKNLDFKIHDDDMSWRAELCDAASNYSVNNYPYQSGPGDDPRKVFDYWEHMKTFATSRVLATFALRILGIVFEAAPVETLFSAMGDIKTPKRNRLAVSLLFALLFTNQALY
jgi:hypothetical protein